MRIIELSNGLAMPVLGSGTNTFGKVDKQYSNDLREGDAKYEEMDWAIESGYRHFDTAAIYRTEPVVGGAIAKSGLPREEFFITTKLNTYEGFKGIDWVEEEIAKSLEALETDYIDLYLLHFNWDNLEEIGQAWSVLERYYQDGVFKAIGVSNLGVKEIDYLKANYDIVPMVNQIESHPGKWQDDMIAYHQENGIVTTAWSPLRGIEGEAESVLEEIGGQYGKTPAQVVLHYQIERGVVVIPKSHNSERQAQNLDVFDFELTDEDKKRIAAL